MIVKRTASVIVSVLMLFLAGCVSTNTASVNDFFKKKYPELFEHKHVETLEKFRAKSLTAYHKGLDVENRPTALVEIIRFPNGNFDNPEYQSFFVLDTMKIEPVFSYDFDLKKILQLEGGIDSDKKTIQFYIELFTKGETKQLENMHKKPENAVSDAGIVYASLFDRQSDIVKGIKFTEFFIPKNDTALD